MKLILLFLSVFSGTLLSFSSSAESATSELNSWWLDVEFDLACDKKFNEFLNDSSGCYSLLSREIVAKKNLKGQDKMDLLGFVFNAKTNMSMKDEGEYVAVGVFSHSGKAGRFLVVAQDSEFKNIVKIFKRVGIKGFSAIKANNQKVNWYFCMDCGDSEILSKTSGGYFLE